MLNCNSLNIFDTKLINHFHTKHKKYGLILTAPDLAIEDVGVELLEGLPRPGMHSDLRLYRDDFSLALEGRRGDKSL